MPAGGFQGQLGDSEQGSEEDSDDEVVQPLQTAGGELVRARRPDAFRFCLIFPVHGRARHGEM